MKPVVIVGGGLAGLSCAVYLQRAEIPFVLLEASDRFGGRVKTDEFDGYLLDRGFQVFLQSYPTARDLFDYPGLDLRSFHPGALFHRGDSFTGVSDPRRRLAGLPATVMSRIGGIGDKLRILKLAKVLRRYRGQPGTTSLQALKAAGFSEVMIDRFFRPFLGGVFLERELSTDASFLEFVWGMFASCDAALPAKGMEELPRQLAGKLPADSVRLNTGVSAVREHSVTLDTGEQIAASSVVLATDGSTAERLLGQEIQLEWNSVTCFYFQAPSAPIAGPWLILNGEEDGPINNLCFPSQVAPRYAPPGRQLVSVSALRTDIDEATVQTELVRWFGESAKDWSHLRTYRLPRALPANAGQPVPPRQVGRPILCGDYTESPSIEGALASGRRASEAVLATLEMEVTP